MPLHPSQPVVPSSTLLVPGSFKSSQNMPLLGAAGKSASTRTGQNGAAGVPCAWMKAEMGVRAAGGQKPGQQKPSRPISHTANSEPDYT